jgi:hypothetical protein
MTDTRTDIGKDLKADGGAGAAASARPTFLQRVVAGIDGLIFLAGAALCFAMVQKLGVLYAGDPLSLDDGWQGAMQLAWLNGWQTGDDIVFPHGPYGGISAKLFHPDLAGTWLAVRLAFGVALAISFVWVFRLHAANGLVSRTRATVLAVAAAAATIPGPDAGWAAPAFLLMATAVDDRDTPPSLLILLLAMIAFTTLAKFSFLVMGAAAVVGWTLAALARGDRMGWIAIPFYAATIAVLWVVAGQDLDAFGDWLQLSFELARGYSAAMSMTSAWIDLQVYAVCLVVLLIGLWLEFRRETPWIAKALLILTWLGLLLLAAKAGFVRHDAHALLPFDIVAVLAAFLVVRLWPPRRETGFRFTAQIVLLLFTIGWLFNAHTRLLPGRATLDKQVSARLSQTADQVIPIPNHLLSDKGKAAQYRERAQEARDLLGGPHPRIAEAATIDVHPFRIGAPIFAGLPYHPRPVVQSYQVYGRALAAQNVDHVRADGAEVYVVHLGSIDGRPPLADGGFLWPVFMSQYDPIARVPLGVVLERKDVPAEIKEREILNSTTAFNTWIDLPAPRPGAMIRIEGDIRPTPLGEFATLLFKPPRLTMTVRFADGSERVHRLVPGQLAVGFPISPSIETEDALQALLMGEAGGRVVTGFRINAGRLQRAFWGESFPLAVTEFGGSGEF